MKENNNNNQNQSEDLTPQEFTDGFKDFSTEKLENMVKCQARIGANADFTETLIKTILQRKGIKYKGIHDDIFDKKQEDSK